MEPGLQSAEDHLQKMPHIDYKDHKNSRSNQVVVLDGIKRTFATPITFTPFASVQPCSARCVFCSETLVPKDGTTLSASLRPGPDYFYQLRQALRELRTLPLGVSLSGLEATDNVTWLGSVIHEFQQHERSGGVLEEKVLYTNGAGLVPSAEAEALIHKLIEFGLTRIELSRHHWRTSVNDRIMRFRPGVSVQDQSCFEKVATRTSTNLPVRLVCVLQNPGVQNLRSVIEYLTWAQTLGIKQVVFRELSRLGQRYRLTRSLQQIEQSRVPLEAILDELWPRTTSLQDGFCATSGTVGYYYWNVNFVYQDDIEVTFESSDYTLMKNQHQSDLIHKLVFHASGDLGADWDPTQQILIRRKRRENQDADVSPRALTRHPIDEQDPTANEQGSVWW